MSENTVTVLNTRDNMWLNTDVIKILNILRNISLERIEYSSVIIHFEHFPLENINNKQKFDTCDIDEYV